MNHQNLKLKELSEKGIDPLTTPDIRYRFKSRCKRSKNNFKAEITHFKVLKIAEFYFQKMNYSKYSTS